MAASGTAIAALEASRNEELVLAEGALLGERRAAWARLAMIAMFGVISNTRQPSRAMTVIGATYTILSIGTLIFVRRAKPAISAARVRPVGVAIVDFAFVSAMGVLNPIFNPGMLAIGCAIVLAFAVARNPTYHVVLSMVLAPACFLAVSLARDSQDLYGTAFITGGLVVLGLMVLLTNRAVRAMFSGLRRRDNLMRFLPRQVAERVIAQGAGSLAPVQREVTVMFTDIRGFTGMSEGLEPRALLALLDDYFGRMSQVVKGHDGVVGKFMGDGMLAFWGVPDRLDDHAARAVAAARDMCTVLAELNRHRAGDELAPIKIGIGIHTGIVAAGMLGGALQAEYTVIGDAVNVASRIEGLTKQHAVDTLISETTWAQLPESRRGRRLASEEIRGRKDPVVLYTLDL